MKFSSDFRAGVRDVAPLLLGILPFALVAGIAAVEAGLALRHAIGLSVLVFAGTAQLAAIDLLGRNAPVTIIVLTAVVINLRMMMYSASIAPQLRDQPARWKALLSYFLTDQVYALSFVRFEDGEVNRRHYYLGVALTLWAVWQVGTVAGVLLGTGIPASWGLEFAIPLVFLAILVPTAEDSPTLVAGLVAAVVAVAIDLPLDLGLLAAAAVGIIAGLITETTGVADGS